MVQIKSLSLQEDSFSILGDTKVLFLGGVGYHCYKGAEKVLF